MPVTVVVGGQFGSEGKGKVAYLLAKEMGATAAVRVGGPNSGHTVVTPDGESLVLRQLPTAAILPDTVCVLAAGSYVIPDLLLQEVEETSVTADRLIIDPHAVVITDADLRTEKTGLLRRDIGSTESGTGAAVIKRISRGFNVDLAENDKKLNRFVRPVSPFLRELIARNDRIVVEGTQGFGLSVLHSNYFPYVTSRDTTAAGFVCEAGLSPFDVDDIVLVLRAFPIRVGGNSGTLPNETTWDSVTRESDSETPIVEYTSVTKRVRRVARFDSEIVLRAITVNQPTRIVLNHIDYVDATCRRSDSLTERAERFIAQVEADINARVDFFGCGPATIQPRLFRRLQKTA